MDRHYDAFISYRHAPLDSKVAADIQSSLERFPIPGALQKGLGKKRIGPIFRDKEELPTTSNLSDDIEKALKNSEYLIVICSTHTAESIWVQREIEAFLQDHDRQHVLTVLADGEPQDVIPDILCHEEVELQGADGSVHIEARNMEPLSCDYRKKRSTAKREELPRLAAAILGCPYDELRQRQRRRQIRQMASAFSAALLLVTAIAAFAINRAVVIAKQAEQIEEEYRNTLINQSRYLAKTSGVLLEQGDRMGAIQVALAALPASEEDDSRPLVTEALYALNNAVYPYHLASIDEFLPKCMLRIDGIGSILEHMGSWQRFSPSGTRWMIPDDAGQIYVFDLNQDARIAVLAPGDVAPAGIGDTFLSADFITEDRVVLYLGNGAVCWDIQKGSAVWTTPYSPVFDSDELSPDVKFSAADSVVDAEHQVLVAALAVANYFTKGELSVYRFDAATGELQTAITMRGLPGPILYSYGCHLALSPDGTRAAVGLDYFDKDQDDEDASTAVLMLVDLEKRSYRTVSPQYNDVTSLAFFPNGQLCIFTTDVAISDYFRHSHPYAVELYNFENGSLAWSVPGEAVLNREVGDAVYPTSSVVVWHRELSDGGTQDMLIVQFGGELLLLDPIDGHTSRTVGFSADIMAVTGYDAVSIFFALRNGKVMEYFPSSQLSVEMGSISEQLRSAGFSTALNEFLLAVDESPNIVVMSNQLEDDSGATIDIHLAGISYTAASDREYRILEERMDDGDDETMDPTRLLFYTPLSETPIAVTDQAHDIESVQMRFSDEGEDICYYITSSEDLDYTLCGWGIQSNQKVLEYGLDRISGNILGFLGSDILYCGKNSFQLRRIDTVSKTEKAIETDEYEHAIALSPDGKYIAVVTQDLSAKLDRLRLLDVEQWTWVDLPEELQALPVSVSYHGSLSFSPDSSKLAVWTGKEIVILDLNTMSVSLHVPIPCKNNGYNRFLNNHILLAYGDSGRLTSWDLDTQSVVMEDLYDDISRGDQVYLGNGYFQAGGDQPNLYTYEEDGSFARYLSVPYGLTSLSGSEVLSFYNDSIFKVSGFENITSVRVYPMYTMNELIAKANEILDGRTLTETERVQYFIDS